MVPEWAQTALSIASVIVALGLLWEIFSVLDHRRDDDDMGDDDWWM